MTDASVLGGARPARAAQLVLLGNELLDAGGGALVAHGTHATSRVSPLRLVWGMAAVTQA